MSKSSIPFSVNIGLDFLKENFPTPDDFKNAFLRANDIDRYGIIRQWITEGVPFAFRNCPLVYEQVREYIAGHLDVHPKEITVVGSARIGFSMSRKGWGRPFSTKSDLDFTIVSNRLFIRLVADFKLWSGDIALKRLKPTDSNQFKRWIGSIEVVNRNIPRGYIYSKNLWGDPRYPAATKCFNTMNHVKERLAATQDAPIISEASVRVYSNWKACISQIFTNKKHALNL